MKINSLKNRENIAMNSYYIYLCKEACINKKPLPDKLDKLPEGMCVEDTIKKYLPVSVY